MRLTISIVSHGHGPMMRSLLADLAPLLADQGTTVVVTLNIPESEEFLTGSGARVLRNESPLGFGANHNQAFRAVPCDYFAVLNPDIRCDWRIFSRLLDQLGETSAGVCAPIVRSPDGDIEDSARTFPTVGKIGGRVVARLMRRRIGLDYELSGSGPIRVDWIAGMFMLFSSQAFARVQGFDERYHMYLEDADICRRLHQSGMGVIVLRDISVVHDARRASHKNLRHLTWHMTSLARFLLR
jgi:GT2 family glycosyltransferase